jgi:hypothetical protein
LVALRSVEKLFELHPEPGGYKLALGTRSGRDIASVVPNIVAAEVFAATHPQSNRKLEKEIARMALDPARHRYVFFAAPGYASGRQMQLESQHEGVHVYAIDL